MRLDSQLCYRPVIGQSIPSWSKGAEVWFSLRLLIMELWPNDAKNKLPNPASSCLPLEEANPTFVLKLVRNARMYKASQGNILLLNTSQLRMISFCSCS